SRARGAADRVQIRRATNSPRTRSVVNLCARGKGLRVGTRLDTRKRPGRETRPTGNGDWLPTGDRLLSVGPRPQEFAVALRFRHFRKQELHAFDGGERRQDFPQHPDAVEIFLRDQQLLFSRAALLDVDRGEHAAIRELAIEMDFEVAGALELFEDDFV